MYISRSRSILRAITWATLAAFGFQELGHAAPALAPTSVIARSAEGATKQSPEGLAEIITDPSLLNVPKEFVSLKETHAGTNGKLIIHIQDAHANLSGQKSLASALDKFMAEYGIETVLSEGGSTDASLTGARRAVPEKERKIAAKRLLYEGLINGQEYLNLTSEHEMKILGIEDAGLYDRNLEAYADLTSKRGRVLAYLRKIRISVSRLKDKEYPKSLRDYENDSGDSGGEDKRIRSLTDIALAAQIDLSFFPEIKKIQHLQGKDPGKSLDEAPKVNFGKIVAEIEELEVRVYDFYLNTPDLKTLHAVDRYLGILERAYDIRLSSGDYRLLNELQPKAAVIAWQAFLNDKLVKLNYYEDMIPFSELLDETFPLIVRFYDLVHERDLAFVRNTEKQFLENSSRTAFLVAGGYHSEHLAELWRKEGYSYAVLTPVVRYETDRADYERVLLASLPAKASQATLAARLARETGPERFAQVAAGRLTGPLVKAIVAKEVLPDAARMSAKDPVNSPSTPKDASNLRKKAAAWLLAGVLLLNVLGLFLTAVTAIYFFKVVGLEWPNRIVREVSENEERVYALGFTGFEHVETRLIERLQFTDGDETEIRINVDPAGNPIVKEPQEPYDPNAIPEFYDNPYGARVSAQYLRDLLIVMTVGSAFIYPPATWVLLTASAILTFLLLFESSSQENKAGDPLEVVSDRSIAAIPNAMPYFESMKLADWTAWLLDANRARLEKKTIHHTGIPGLSEEGFTFALKDVEGMEVGLAFSHWHRRNRIVRFLNRWGFHPPARYEIFNPPSVALSVYYYQNDKVVWHFQKDLTFESIGIGSKSTSRMMKAQIWKLIRQLDRLKAPTEISGARMASEEQGVSHLLAWRWGKRLRALPKQMLIDDVTGHFDREPNRVRNTLIYLASILNEEKATSLFVLTAGEYESVHYQEGEMMTQMSGNIIKQSMNALIQIIDGLPDSIKSTLKDNREIQTLNHNFLSLSQSESEGVKAHSGNENAPKHKFPKTDELWKKLSPSEKEEAQENAGKWITDFSEGQRKDRESFDALREAINEGRGGEEALDLIKEIEAAERHHDSFSLSVFGLIAREILANAARMAEDDKSAKDVPDTPSKIRAFPVWIQLLIVTTLAATPGFVAMLFFKSITAALILSGISFFALTKAIHLILHRNLISPDESTLKEIRIDVGDIQSQSDKPMSDGMAFSVPRGIWRTAVYSLYFAALSTVFFSLLLSMGRSQSLTAPILLGVSLALTGLAENIFPILRKQKAIDEVLIESKVKRIYKDLLHESIVRNDRVLFRSLMRVGGFTIIPESSYTSRVAESGKEGNAILLTRQILSSDSATRYTVIRRALGLDYDAIMEPQIRNASKGDEYFEDKFRHISSHFWNIYSDISLAERSGYFIGPMNLYVLAHAIAFSWQSALVLIIFTALSAIPGIGFMTFMNFLMRTFIVRGGLDPSATSVPDNATAARMAKVDSNDAIHASWKFSLRQLIVIFSGIS